MKSITKYEDLKNAAAYTAAKNVLKSLNYEPSLVNTLPPLFGILSATRLIYRAMNAISSTELVGVAAATAVKVIVFDCTPPVIKYSLKCGILAAQFALALSISSEGLGESRWLFLAIDMMNFTVED